jgi:hypothetical protein
MTETEFRQMLTHAVYEGTEGSADVSSFQDAGVMTYNEGLVVRMDDGTEFQVTVVASR